MTLDVLRHEPADALPSADLVAWLDASIRCPLSAQIYERDWPGALATLRRWAAARKLLLRDHVLHDSAPFNRVTRLEIRGGHFSIEVVWTARPIAEERAA